MRVIRVFALMLNFEGLDDTRHALTSLNGIKGLAGTIVLDNGSSRDESAALRAEFSHVDIRRSKENLGFARGVNLIASVALRAGATHLLLINNDAELAGSAAPLSALIAEFDRDPTCVAVGPVILNTDGSVQSAGYMYTPWIPIPRARRRIPDRALKVSGFLSGSCLLLDAVKFASLGGFDPDFFLYGEDLDFALRAVSEGMTMALAPSASVYHRRAASSRLYSSRYIYTVLRGNLIASAKHSHWYHWPSVVATFLATSCALTILGITRGQMDAPRAAILAWTDFFAKRWSGLTGAALKPCVRPSLAECASVCTRSSTSGSALPSVAQAT